MTKPRHSFNSVKTALLCSVCLSLGGCVVGTVGGAAIGVAATTVKTGVRATGAVVRVGAKATGAVVRTATGN